MLVEPMFRLMVVRGVAPINSVTQTTASRPLRSNNPTTEQIYAMSLKNGHFKLCVLCWWPFYLDVV